MQPLPKKSKEKHVHLEREKARCTSHWDMDYMPLQKMRALYRRKAQWSAAEKSVESQPSRSHKRLGVALILAGLALLGVAALLGRWCLG